MPIPTLALFRSGVYHPHDTEAEMKLKTIINNGKLSGDTLLRVGGSEISFRCHCGCNVFRKVSEMPLKYECNACGDWYIAEKEDMEARDGINR